MYTYKRNTTPFDPNFGTIYQMRPMRASITCNPLSEYNYIRRTYCKTVIFLYAASFLSHDSHVTSSMDARRSDERQFIVLELN